MVNGAVRPSCCFADGLSHSGVEEWHGYFFNCILRGSNWMLPISLWARECTVPRGNITSHNCSVWMQPSCLFDLEGESHAKITLGAIVVYM